MVEPNVEPGRGPPQLVVTLRPAAFAAASSRLGGTLGEWVDIGRKQDFEGRLQMETVFQPPADGGQDPGFAIIETLERDGMLVDAQSLALPIGGENNFTVFVPLGGGRATMAAAASFSLRGRRPSDEILSGSMILTFVDEAAVNAAINRLSDAPQVVALVERVPARHLISSVPGVAGAAWHLGRTNADRARQVPGYRDGSQVVVAVIDSGVDAGHPMLSPGISTYTSSYPDGARTGARDLLSHGTHVSGVIGARGDVDGVCRAQLRVLKVFRDVFDYDSSRRPDGSWHFTASAAPAELMYVQALGMCLDENVPVMNFSLGYSNPHTREADIFASFARNGQAVVAATGNGGPGAPVVYPALYGDAIAVGALGRDDRAASFSSSAANMLVSAPGVDIVGTMPTYEGAVDFEASINAQDELVRGAAIPWSRRTGTMTGTSSAAPQVSAAAALWIARNGRDLPRLRDRLAATARKLPEMNGADRTDRHGHGCLDVAALLD